MKTYSSVVLVPSSVALDNSFIWQRNLLKNRSLLLFRRWFILVSFLLLVKQKYLLRVKYNWKLNNFLLISTDSVTQLFLFHLSSIFTWECSTHTRAEHIEREYVCVRVKEAGRGCVCRGARHTSAAMPVCKAPAACVSIKNRNFYFFRLHFSLKINFWLINNLIYNLSYCFSTCLRFISILYKY